MASCPSCGKEMPGEFPFCPFCGAPLVVEPARPAAEERKIVTVLFCDLVGFTAAAERDDPEDIDRMLSEYAAVARGLIESHGGVMEKFIGDAAVGVFGVPAAHEDDPERAVRAGLRIVEEAERLQGVGGPPLRLRVGINTGEALVRLGIAAASGDGFLRGDAINTASRIQSIAPEMGVAVGVTTYEATAQVFDYEELEPASLKGKSAVVRVFRATAARARFGTDLTRTHDSPFIGREIDLALLKGIFDKTVAANSVQLVTVVGEPGLGKSRLVAELFGYIDSRPELITWRQGRCLPYGEGITFWALGEILKAHIGILESDSPEVTQAKLDAVLPAGDEREWFRQRLLPLLGIEASSQAERQELFAAWRRFLERIAEQRPTVLVFEDLHWADEALLAFLEHLADLAEGVPLLLVGTARPELYERHPDYAKALRNATPINLAPLSQEETARLILALLDATVLPGELQQPILDRAGGNPLYAEEFVRLLKDRDLLEPSGSSWRLKAGAEVPFPESLQALIAARLDTLDPDAKSLLADAAVVGKVFWAGAVARMGERELAEVTAMLRELSRKELVRPIRHSSMQNEVEYAFGHVLARDVAYSQLPRPSRAARHVAAARWIESKAPDRVEDLADVLAFHYATALELAQAAGQSEQASNLEASALRFLGLAGERALGLDTTAALASFRRALALTPQGHPDRPKALSHFGDAAIEARRYDEAKDALEEAIATFEAAGEVRGAARAMGSLSRLLMRLGDPRTWTVAADAVALLEPLPLGADMVAMLAELASTETLQGRPEAGVRHAERALSLAEQLGLGQPARALGVRGQARVDAGDSAGLEDIRKAVDLATRAGQGVVVAALSNNLGVILSAFEGPMASVKALRSAVAFAAPRGLTGWVQSATTSMLDPLLYSGRFDEALELAAGLVDGFGDDELWDLAWARAVEAAILAMRGQATQVVDALEWLETTVRETGSAQHIVFGLGAAALARASLGEGETATKLVAEVEAHSGAREIQYYSLLLPEMVRTAISLGNQPLAKQLVTGVEPHTPQAEHALAAANATLAEARGELQAAADAYVDAAERWNRFGAVTEEAYALLGQGRCLTALARRSEATQPLQNARTIFQKLEAAPALAETDELLHRAEQLSA